MSKGRMEAFSDGVLAQRSQGGAISMTSHYDGPLVEVVVTHDTTIYRDVTMKQFDGSPPDGKKLQQVLEPGSVDEIGENSNGSGLGRMIESNVPAQAMQLQVENFSFLSQTRVRALDTNGQNSRCRTPASAYQLTICRSCLAASTAGTMPRRIRVAAWDWLSSRPS
jgi:hypothetical protein